MDRCEFERVLEQFGTFHAYFASAFGRKERQEYSRKYLQGLLVQCQERRNGENLAEAVAAAPRNMQHFLARAPWSDAALIDRLQCFAGGQLSHPEAVWAVDETGFPKQGKKSAGVARQYCGTLGKVANCQMGVFLAYLSPAGQLLVDKELYLPLEWTQDERRLAEAEVPQEARGYRSKAELALVMLTRAVKRGHLSAAWVTGDDAYGSSPLFRDGVAALGLWYVAEVPSNTPVWPEVVEEETPPYKGRGPRPQPRPKEGQRLEVRERRALLPREAWQEVVVGEGAQGPRGYRFALEWVRQSREGTPAGMVWLIHRENLDGSEPRSYFSNAPRETPLCTLARVAASRWPIETEFENSKQQVGLDEYEVRSWQGWHHHMTLCLLANAFLLWLEREWGKKAAADHPAAGVSGGAGTAAAQAMGRGRVVVLASGNPGAQRAGEAVPHPASSTSYSPFTPSMNFSL